jgi:hypothetical protein
MDDDYPIKVGATAGTCNKCGDRVAIVADNERRCADIVAGQEFHQIKKFVAACRRQWPGAKVTLRPDRDGLSTGADAPPPNQNRHQE